MKRRSRPTRSGRVIASWRWILAVSLLAVVLAGITPAELTTTGQMDRAVAMNVVADELGVLGLNVASSVQVNKIDPLVNVTNNYDSSVTVTVTLDDVTAGDLYLNGDNQGSEAVFTLASGNVQTVRFEANPPPGATVSFDVTATAIGLEVRALNRQTQTTGGGGPPLL